jgi:AraC family transcriptional regulator
MAAKTLQQGDLTIFDYRCEATPADRPFTEVHERFSLSYVRKGSFGCRTLGRHFELVAGGFLLGCPGDEFVCTHEHRCGDECLSIQLSPALSESLGGRLQTWRIGALPPVAELTLIAELAQAATRGETDLGLDEASLLLVGRFLELRLDPKTTRTPANPAARSLMVRIADWIECRSSESIDLAASARQAGLSPYHFLRTFSSIVGITPHQHLIRCRLRRAAKRLLEEDSPVTAIALGVGFEDVSNFVRCFHRAAGVSPRAYRRLAATDRNIFQELLRRPGFTGRTR